MVSKSSWTFTVLPEVKVSTNSLAVDADEADFCGFADGYDKCARSEQLISVDFC